MTSVSLDAFLQPRGIAILGASGDPAKLGKALALALITTLYGILWAQLLFKNETFFLQPI